MQCGLGKDRARPRPVRYTGIMRMMHMLLAGVAVLALHGSVLAETIHLKGGSKVTGRIIEKTDDAVKVEVKTDSGTAVMSIKRSRIDRIEEATTLAERLQAARAKITAGEFRVAEAELRELLKMDPKHAGARMALAEALCGSFRYEEAIKTLENYLILVPVNRDPELMLQLAQYYLESQNFRDARKVAREAADLYPENKDLSLRVEEFLKRIERVRNGTEQLKERDTAEKAELRKRKEERAQFDKQRGNNFDAQETADDLTAWTAETAPKLLSGLQVDLGAPDDAIAAYLNGGETQAYRDRVTRAQATVRVDQARWLEMYDHEKAVLLYGWYYQLRQRYNKTFPTVLVVCTVKEGGADKDKNLARASWDGRKEQVVVDRWTKENRQPNRPIKPKAIK